MKRFYMFLSMIVLTTLLASQAMAQTAITGTKTVGTGGDYSNIKLAFDAINTNDISGDVVLQIISDQTLTSAATLDAFSSSASLTIYPTGDYEISGSFGGSNGIIQFDGCSNVVLDGSLNGTGSDRSLWINHTVNSSIGVRFMGASNVDLKNCRISSGALTGNPSTAYAIRMYYTDGYSDNITIDNNLIDRGYYGIYIYGSSTTNVHENITITNNDVFPGYMYYGIYGRYVDDLVCNYNEVEPSQYMYYMTYFYYVNNLEASHNRLRGLENYSATTYYPYYGLYAYYTSGDIEINYNDVSQTSYGLRVYYPKNNNMGEIAHNNIYDITYYGMYIYQGSTYNFGGFDIHHNEISRVQKRQSTTSSSSIVGMYLGYMDPCLIHDNYIYDIINYYEGTGNYPGYTAGIYLYGNATKANEGMQIYHNRIKSVTSRGTDYSSSTGYYFHYMPAGILGHTVKDLEIYQNTIHMDMPFTAGGVQGAKSACITLGGYYVGSSGNTIKNNILVNDMVGNGTESYCIYLPGYSSYINSVGTADYNVLSCPNGSIAANDGTNTTYAYLSSWQSAGYGDNSTDMEVSLTSDCHVDGQAAISEDLSCPPITSVSIPTDIDGETRTADNNKMGVDITSFTLELTNDLIVDPDRPDGLCEGTQQIQFLFGAGGNFDDGIERALGNAVQTQWYKDGLPIVDTDTDNITISGNRLIINDLMVANAGEYYARFWAMDLEPIQTSSKTVTVVEPVSIVSEDMVESYLGCEGFHDLTLSVETNNAFGVQWQKEVDGIWTDIEGATNHSFTLDFTELTKVEADGKYRAKVVGDELCEPKYPSILYTDTETEVELYLPVSNETMEYYFDTENLCGGMDLEFYATADGSVNGYQWQKYQGGQWYNITDKENPTAVTQNLKLTDVNETNTGAYRCKILGNAECYDEEVFTEEVAFVIPPTFELLENPESQVICGGEEVRFQVIGNGLGEIHSYQWYKDGVAISTASNEYADDAVLIINDANINNVGQYYCEIEVEDCRGELTFTSETSILYVLQDTKITRQPRSEEVALGETAILAVEAHMKGLIPPYYQHDFQWYKGNVALEDNARIQGAHSSMLTIKNVEAGDLGNDYHVVVKGQCGTDESVMVSISDVPTVSITMNPMDKETCEGSTATFEATAKSTDVTIAVDYQWYFNGNPLTDGGEISGAMTSKLEIADVMMAHAGDYYVTATLNGTTETAMSKTAELTVALLPMFTTLPDADVTIETDAELTLEVEVDSESDVTYQWYKDGMAIAGATEATYTVDMVKYADAGEYYCEATNNCGTRMSDMSMVTVTKKTDPNSVFEQMGSGYALLGNHPNPFAGATTIKFTVPVATNVVVTLTDASGRKLAVIFDGMAVAGENNIDLDATSYNLSSGTYFYTVEAEGAAAAKAMILVK